MKHGEWLEWKEKKMKGYVLSNTLMGLVLNNIKKKKKLNLSDFALYIFLLCVIDMWNFANVIIYRNGFI